MVESVAAQGAPTSPNLAVGTLSLQVLERPLRPGEDSLDDLERAFRETPVDPPAAKTAKAAPAEAARRKTTPRPPTNRSASPSIRSNT